MILRTDPFMNTQFNAPITSIDEMDRVDGDEAERMNGFLTFGALESLTAEGVDEA